MLFNSIDFVVFFIAVLAIITILRYKKFQHLFLVIASYFFFYYTSDILISLLIFSTVLDFYVGKEIFHAKTVKKKKILLAASLTGNLGLLGFFKYADFGIEQFNVLLGQFNLPEFPLLEIILPIGISFYTFQTISYTVDIYRGSLTPSKSFREFALFVAFFPQLVAGPILRANQFLPQLREKLEKVGTGIKLRQIIIKNSNLKFGITLMTIGFFKKMFFADNIAPLANQVFENPVGLDSFSIILGTIAFGFQIYGDFSGYSDIAIGAALILGFYVPKNFNKPYFATSPSDFWRRWHISLSTWVRDYLFFPLILKNRKSAKRLFASLFTSFFLLGLWHGAGWNFIIFGMIHGVFVAVDTVIRKKIPYFSEQKFFKTRTGKIISILITQYLIFFAFIAFRVRDIDNMLYSMQKFVFWDFEIESFLEIISVNKIPIVLIIIFIILHFISYKKENLIESISKLKIRYWIVFFMIILGSITLLYDLNPHDFIYFKF